MASASIRTAHVAEPATNPCEVICGWPIEKQSDNAFVKDTGQEAVSKPVSDVAAFARTRAFTTLARTLASAATVLKPPLRSQSAEWMLKDCVPGQLLRASD